ncbi:uncharacterized protein FFB20_11482 [Fusarium fujikuroi]|uniref:Uncharacterized protein n=2 Tax=Fusarium fujikuroi TaxID=5127 RepID=S0DJW0_GIBF5|nr:uncharacterized protein FFUJ_00760 [Fusarium fujikuroi IMI 58289]KLO96679.1 uncharacterized protein Y057_3389 [Fusarium fujikuroi]QGI59136.1 hypothetical protein CEK27_001261 [Fusarium fujikuroi]QGI90046.1 hypothetical protein CEK26_001261 [Fusarium fujikuroi]CCT62665.1 uncharacterized protein FFUJ_00760 [Fusarium fujikuroi IMI 58289]SCN67081.1 uncharacterized protein FFE2_00828 [Fusarium fujikuroi]
MNSRGKTSSQHQSGMGAQPGNFIATGQQAYPIGASGPLVDVSNYGGASGRQSNAVPQNRFNGQNNSSMNEFLTMQESRVNGFLQHSAQQIDMQRSALQQVANHLSSTATNIGQSIAQWMGHPASERAAALYQELEKSRGRQIDADNQYRQLKDEYQALEKRLQDSNTELENAIRERDKQRLLAESANWTGSTKVSDDAIQSKWKQLGYNIRAMSRSLAKCQIHRPQNDETKNRLSMAVPRSKKLLLNDDHKEFVISAYLWAIVAEIIEEGSEIMGGDHGMNFKAIRAEFIGAAPEGDKPSGRGPTLRHVARWEMKAIIDTALELDEMLMNSKAIFTIRRPESDGSKNQRFDATEMEAFIQGKDLSSKTVVEFAISPMLIKMGNADGCNYDSRMVVCKSLVVCR